MSNIHVIEVGFGNNAVITGADQKGNPELLCFPSIVAKVNSSKNDLSSGIAQRNTKVITVDGIKYEIGPDAHLAADDSSGRVFNSEYIRSTQYKALLFGSMAYIQNTEIDLLVLGLPVNTWKRRNELKELAIGTHEIDGKTYNVKNVWCVPQPLGGLLAYGAKLTTEEFQELAQQNTLAADPGMLTFDWIVSRGLQVNDSRSGAEDLGMSTVLREVSERLKEAFSLDKLSLDQVDNAFWKHPGKFKIFGKDYSFPVCDGDHGKTFDCTSTISQATGNAVTAMRNTVGDGADIGLIILMGGAAYTYLPAIEAAYPDHKIIVLENHLTAVCEGMYWGGIEYFKQLQKSKGAA